MRWSLIVLACVRAHCLSVSTHEDRRTGCHFCNRTRSGPVCGMRQEEGGVRVRVFESECKLQKHGCSVPETDAYSSVKMEYCTGIFGESTGAGINSVGRSDATPNRPGASNMCDAFHCYRDDTNPICALRKDRGGYRTRLFPSRCDFLKHNCEHGPAFNETDVFICDPHATSTSDLIVDTPVEPKLERVIVINARSMKYRRNLNQSVEDFFAATHRRPLALDEVAPTRRNMILKTASPVVIFKPWVRVPKNKSDDHWHRPTLSSCYHKCPVKCPDTYTPVCGVPGVAAREPSLIFKNHCFMDKAQCKMFWEDNSPTAESSNYVEGSFIFCLGDELTSLYRFLPLIKSLQRMGRLKQRGRFRYKLRNFRYETRAKRENKSVILAAMILKECGPRGRTR